MATRKIPSSLTAQDASAQIFRLARAFYVTDINLLIVMEAMRGARDHNLPLWDAQIWACAKLNQIPVVISEDFPDGSILEGISFVNPFLETFDSSRIG